MTRVLQAAFLILSLSVPALSQDPVPAPVQDTLEEQGRSPLFRRIYGRQDTTGTDQQAEESLDPAHSPSQAIMYALALPGLGQAYNQKYYKIPIVWAAFGGAGYAINFNSGKYREASREYVLDPEGQFSERALRYWRRNRELSYIALLVIYALQVVDAYVDAQLYFWNVNENLAISVTPSIQPMLLSSGDQRPVFGMSCSINLGK